MYYNENIDEIYIKLNAKENGLDFKEVENRLKNNGKNILPHKKRPSILTLYLKEFTSPIEIILIFTVIISFFVGEIIDAMVIIFIILVDTIMGAYQENKALKSAESFKRRKRI